MKCVITLHSRNDNNNQSSRLNLFEEETLNQAMELCTLGSEIEAERQKLTGCINQHGISSALTLEQSKKLDVLICKFADMSSL